MKPETIRLTQEQIDALPKRQSDPYPTGRVGWLLDIPVVRVDTVEESTPFQMEKDRIEREGKRLVSFGGRHFVMDPEFITKQLNGSPQ